MKIIYIFFIVLHLSNHPAICNSENILINDIGKNSFNSYLLNSADIIKSNFHCSQSDLLLFTDNYSLLNNIKSFEYLPDRWNINRTIPKEININLNVEGTENYADISGEFSFKSRYYAFRSDINFNTLENYNSNQDDAFNPNDVFYNKFTFNNYFGIFDKTRYLNFSASNYFGNMKFLSLYDVDAFHSRNDRIYGNYSVAFGSEYRDYSIAGKLNYITFSEKSSFSNRDVSYYPDYHNLNFTLAMDYNLSEELIINAFMNYSEGGLSNFLYPELFLGRIETERISSSFNGKYNFLNGFSVKFGLKVSSLNLSHINDIYFVDVLPEYNVRATYDTKKSGDFSLIAISRQIPLIIPDDKSSEVSYNICAGALYNYESTDFSFSSKIYYNYYENPEDYSDLFETETFNLNNIGFYISAEYNAGIAEVSAIYSFNDLDAKDIPFYSLISGHSYFLRLAKNIILD